MQEMYREMIATSSVTKHAIAKKVGQYFGVPAYIVLFHCDEVFRARHIVSLEKWKKKNPEKAALINQNSTRKYMETHKKEVYERRKKKYWGDPIFREKMLESNRVWQRKNKERIAKNNRKRYQRIKDLPQTKEARHAYYIANREKILMQTREREQRKKILEVKQ